MISKISAIARRCKWIFFTFLMYFFRVFPIKKNKILFVNYYGKGYGDNGKYICEELIKTGKNIDVVWACSTVDNSFPSSVRLIKYMSIKFFFELCTSKVWVDNCRKPLFIRKRKKQFYIQTWHGDIGMKKVENDAVSSLYKSYIRGAKNDSRMADVFISGNDWMTNKYYTSFWYNGVVEKCGYPRRDILYNMNKEKKLSIIRKLGLDPQKKYVLYAPTFRKKQAKDLLECYILNWNDILDELKNKFSVDFQVLIRFHPNITDLSGYIDYSENVIDVSKYPDMQELMAISEICISDYSSSIFEFAVTGKVGFLFANDFDDYKKDRDVYFDIIDLPFPFASNITGLLKNIELFNKNEYLSKLNNFYKNKIRLYKEGNASKFISELIISKCM